MPRKETIKQNNLFGSRELMRGALSEMIEETMSDSCCDTADRKYQIRTEKPNSDTADNTFSSFNIHLKNYTVTEDNIRSEQKHLLLASHFRTN